MIIPTIGKERIWLNKEEETKLKEFFSSNRIISTFNSIDSCSSDNKDAWYFIFEYWLFRIDTTNVKLVKALPYFLIYCGVDFRSYYNICSHWLYNEYFSSKEEKEYFSRCPY